MFITYLINAIIGAFIGFITNYLAIKMLFKPDKPVYIGKFRVPFTPGIIPKEKMRLAQSIGTVVGNKLLTGEVLEKALKDEDINLAMDKLINDTVADLENSESTLKDMLALVFTDKEKINDTVCLAAGRYLKAAVRSEETLGVCKDLLNRMIAELLSTPIKSFDHEMRFLGWADKGIGFLMNLIKDEGFIEKLELQTVHFVEKASGNASPLSSYLPDQFFEAVKHAVSANAESFGGIVTGLLENPQVEKNMQDILGGLMDTSLTTRVINVFVSKENVYKRIKQKTVKYVESEKGQQELVGAIHQHVDKLKATSVGEIVKHANREDVYHMVGSMLRFTVGSCLDAKFDEMLSGHIRKYISENPDITLAKLLEPVSKGEIPYGKFVDDTVELIIQNYADRWLEEIVSLTVPRLMDLKINRFAALISGNERNPGSTVTRVLFSLIKSRTGEIIKALNIPKLITDKINEYDIAELDEMILSIIDRELKAIIFLGAVFGFIIGLAGPIISGLLR